MGKGKKNPEGAPSAKAVSGQPETADEMLLKYGTYEVQPTADSGNEFPQIAQGLPKPAGNSRRKNKR